MGGRVPLYYLYAVLSNSRGGAGRCGGAPGGRSKGPSAEVRTYNAEQQAFAGGGGTRGCGRMIADWAISQFCRSCKPYPEYIPGYST